MSRVKIDHFIPLKIAVLTVSNSRTRENDTAGDLLVEKLLNSGHFLSQRDLCSAELYQIRALVSLWIASNDIQVILISGGTGLTCDDVTPEAVMPLFDKSVDGFGELFRHLSLEQVGSSTLQSRAVAGLANGTLIAAMPGSPKACETGWEGILAQQLDARHGPCNFVPQLKDTQAALCAAR